MKNTENKALAFAPELSHAEILTNPILDIAARFWEATRYKAFKICYRSMRLIDDMVDDKKAGGPIEADEAAELKGQIKEWLGAVSSTKGSNALSEEFISAMQRFKIPIWPWERLSWAMDFDLTHDGFRTFTEFIRYSRGAAVAPAAVFMHLCGVKKGAGGYLPPPFDIRKAARPLALFSYLVHTVRDFQKDQGAGLNNFPDDLVLKRGLTKDGLKDIALGAETGGEFRSLMRDYVRYIGFYQLKARRMIDETALHIDTRAHLSLEVIYGLYSQIFERIDPEHGTFSAEELNPAAEEVEQKLDSIISAF